MNYSYTYPVSNGSIEVIVSEEQAVEKSRNSTEAAYPTASEEVRDKIDEMTYEDHLNAFISLHWADKTDKAPGTYIVSYTDSPVPVGATHLGPYGYIKQKGKFFYIYKQNGWLALSGEPVGTLYKL